MTVDLSALFQAVLASGLIGFGIDHFRLRAELGAFKVHVAEKQASKDDLKEVTTAVKAVDSRVEAMMALLYEIKGQMGALGHDGSR